MKVNLKEEEESESQLRKWREIAMHGKCVRLTQRVGRKELDVDN